MPLPTISAQWHPTKGWTEAVADVDWVTIANPMREMVFDRGTNEHSERTEASTLTLTLDDRDRSLDPTNRMSPNWGNLLPRRHLRIIAVIGGVTYSLWRGFTTGFVPDWTLGDATVTIGGVDLLGLLASVEMPSSYLRLYLASLAPKWSLNLDEAGGDLAYSTGSDRTPWIHVAVKTNAGELIPYDPVGSVSYGETGASRTVYPGLDRISPPFTVLFWIEVEPGPSAVVDPYSQGQGGMANFPDGDLGFRIQTDGLGLMGVADGARSAYVKTARLDLGRPVFVAGRYDLIAGVPTMKMRVNQTDASATHAAPLIFPRSGPAYLGNSIPLDRPFRGAISGFARFDRYLSDAELNNIFLAGYYPLDGQRSDERIASVLDAAGVPAALRNLDVGESLLGPWRLDRYALENVARAVATERGRMFVDRQGRLTFHARHHAGTVRGVYSTKPEATAGAGLMALELTADDRSFYTVARGSIPTPTETTVEYRHPNAATLGEIPWSEPTAFRSQSDADVGIRDVVGAATPQPRLSSATSRYGGPGVVEADLLLTEVGDLTTLVGHPPDSADPVTYGPFVTWGGVLTDPLDGWGSTSADDGWGGPPPLTQSSVVLGLTHHLDGRGLTYDVSRSTAPVRSD